MAPEEILGSAGAGRRDFLKKVLAGTTFAAPVIASFSMEGLSPEKAGAAAASNQCFPLTSNSTSGGFNCCSFAAEIAFGRFGISSVTERVMTSLGPLETAALLARQLGKAQAAMLEGILKGQGECVNRPAVDQFKKAAKELGKFNDLAVELCGADAEELVADVEFLIQGINNLVNGNCSLITIRP